MANPAVTIIGGGPVGLTLALDLAWRGVPCTVVEERTSVTRHPKATLLGARSMELFRRWRLDEPVFDAAMAADERYHIIFTSRLAAHEMFRFTSPSIAEVRRRDPEARKRFRELAWSPYAKTQIGQQALEPVLIEAVARQPLITFLRGWRCHGIDQRDDITHAGIEHVASGERRTLCARFAVGCDGGTSGVRRELGIRLRGRGKMRANTSFFFRSTSFMDAHGLGLANLYFVFTADSFGVFTAIDGRELWNYQYYFLDPAKEKEDLDPAAILHRAMGRPFDFDLIDTTRWHHHQSVAGRWRRGNIFLAGDAAHLFAPTGGVGMNTGIGDACDLAWKIAAVHDGWGGDWLLDSYEAERRPIAIRNSLISATNSDKIDMVMADTPPDIDRNDGIGEARRRELAGRIKWLARQFNSAGTHLGYRYADSPIVVADGTPEPPDDMGMVVPTTWPGSRAPHHWVDSDTSTLDLFRGRFTLLSFGRSDDGCAALTFAFDAAGIPLDRHVIVDPEMAALYERRYVLVRPDGHVAWRADEAPAPGEAAIIVERVRGADEPDYPAAVPLPGSGAEAA